MARPEQCKDCTKKTTIHFTQIINNKVYKLDMCEDCPMKKEVIDPGSFSLTEIFGNEPGEPKGKGLACATCGLTEEEFEKRGRLGCPDCYEHFAPAVRTLIKDMHYGTTHVGKKAKLAVKRVDLNGQIQQLKTELSEAIKSENFEQAAVLRDKIIELEAQVGAMTGAPIE
jgi:protein arginine kinase activator